MIKTCIYSSIIISPLAVRKRTGIIANFVASWPLWPIPLNLTLLSGGSSVICNIGKRSSRVALLIRPTGDLVSGYISMFSISPSENIRARALVFKI